MTSFVTDKHPQRSCFDDNCFDLYYDQTVENEWLPCTYCTSFHHQVFSECRVSPLCIRYVETGTQAYEIQNTEEEKKKIDTFQNARTHISAAENFEILVKGDFAAKLLLFPLLEWRECSPVFDDDLEYGILITLFKFSSV